MAAQSVRIAIIGTGGMAGAHVEHYKQIRGVQLVAGVDVDLARAKAFCERHGIPLAFGSVKELIASGKAEAVSIVTPDAFHAPITLECLRAKLHVLCEKPLALNAADARKMLAAAKKAGVIHMVNLSYRDWPAIQKVASLVADGTLGDIRHVEASYLQAWLVSNAWGDWRTTPSFQWRLSSAHGSKGALGDVGVHIVDFAMFPVGPITSVHCILKAFPKAPGNRLGEYTLDANDSAVITAEYKNGALGVIDTTRWCAGHDNRLALKISGTKGSIDIDSERATDAFRICAGRDVHTATWKEIQAPPTPNNYKRFVQSIRTGKNDQPDFQCGLDAQKVLDACFASDASHARVKV